MRVTDSFALAGDVLVIRVSDLPLAVRDEIGERGAFVVTRARGRTPSVLVDDVSAELLGEFLQVHRGAATQYGLDRGTIDAGAGGVKA